jgi:uncharacterized protein
VRTDHELGTDADATGVALQGTRRRRWPVRLLIGVVAFLALFYLGGGWYFSSMIHDRALSGAERRASLDPSYDLTVLSTPDGSIWLRPTDEAPRSLDAAGTFGLRYDGGYGQVGPLVGSDGADVAREFLVIRGDPPTTGMGAQLDARAYPDPATAGVRTHDVTITGPLGDYPAWYVEPASPARATWIVLVHGNSMSRLDVVRVLPSLRDAGWPTLTVTYRNDEGAPEDPSGLLRYGLTEWADLEAAVHYALDRGSDGIALYGVSMGGGVIAAFLQKSHLASEVRALVLDAPMMNFSQTVDDNASRETLIAPLEVPGSLTAVAKWIAERRFGVDWSALDYLATPDIFGVATLVFHGGEDLTVPVATSEELARLRPDTVTLVTCPGADHIECWNLDPRAYQERMAAFLDRRIG